MCPLNGWLEPSSGLCLQAHAFGSNPNSTSPPVLKGDLVAVQSKFPWSVPFLAISLCKSLSQIERHVSKLPSNHLNNPFSSEESALKL
jgi:hypothetical protein